MRTYVRLSEAESERTAEARWDKLIGAPARGTLAEAWADAALEAYNKALAIKAPYTQSTSKAQHQFVSSAAKYTPSWSGRQL